VRERIGVAHGRFQPLHLGHLEYLLAAKALCRLLLVGITNPDPSQITQEPAEPRRSAPSSNPCTYYERYVMVERALVRSGVRRAELRVVPFPHSYPERLRYYLPADPLLLLTVYDQWSEVKASRFEALGLRTRVLWRRDQKVTSGSAIRERIARGQPWEHLVPVSTAAVIHEFGIEQRIRELLALVGTAEERP